LDNCSAFAEFDGGFDDDAILYHEELDLGLKEDRV